MYYRSYLTYYRSQAARDAQAANYGTRRYWNYLEEYALELHHKLHVKGDYRKAELMLTRTLSDVLKGNCGD